MGARSLSMCPSRTNSSRSARAPTPVLSSMWQRPSSVLRPKRQSALPRAPEQRERPSHLAVLRVPVALEVVDQGRAEVAKGLLARVDGEIGAEGVERLL